MWEPPLFLDRAEAGRVLADRLKRAIRERDILVLALPRGGVPVGFEIAEAFHADLDILLVRKLGVPGHEELAMGAIASGGVRVLNNSVIERLRIPPAAIERVTERELREIARREALYRDGRRPQPVEQRNAVLVDDGLATGATMLAAARAVYARHPDKVIVAVPVAAPEACEDFRERVDQIVCAETPEPFQAVGIWYQEFPQTSDDEVRALLERAARLHVH